MNDIVVRSYWTDFVDACHVFERVHGHKPYKAVISRRAYEGLVDELGQIFYRGPRAELGLELNGVKLEVVG